MLHVTAVLITKFKFTNMWNCGVTFIVCVMIGVSISSTLFGENVERMPQSLPFFQEIGDHTGYYYEEHVKDSEMRVYIDPPTPLPLPLLVHPLPLSPISPPSILPGHNLRQPGTLFSPGSPGIPEGTGGSGESGGPFGPDGTGGPSTRGCNSGQSGISGRPSSLYGPGGLKGPSGSSGPSTGGYDPGQHGILGSPVSPGSSEGPGGARGPFNSDNHPRKRRSPASSGRLSVNEGSKCFGNRTCARKCCPRGLGWDVQNTRCRSLPESIEFNPKIWVDYSVFEVKHAEEKLNFLEGNIICSASETRTLATNVTSVFRLQSDGKLVVESYFAAGPELEFDINKYCMDRFFIGNETKLNAFICLKQNNFKIKWHYLMTGSCMLTICFMVLLRVIVFAWLPELRTLHGIILVAYLMSFLVGFLLLGSKMLLMYEQKVDRHMCFILSYVAYFSIMSAFFWRNVMCYDIWWTFSGKRALSGQSSTSRKRLYVYCAYAFGGPTALTGLLGVLETSPYSKKYNLMPKIWIHGCNSLYGYSKLIYFYGPIMILFVANMILFTLTALKIAAIKKETKMIFNSQDSQRKDDQKNEARRFKIFAKLFAAMVFLEVTWMLEIITIFYPDTEIILHVIDICNMGMILFTIINFLCQKQTWKMIIKRYKQITSNSG